MWQQGQVFKLKARGLDGQPLWAYRYRLEGRGSTRPQVVGFATRAEALKALEKVLTRLGPGGRAATITLAELVDEYLEMYQAEQVTIAKLRWLLGKATVSLGDVRLAELSPKDVYAWRLTIPEGHRFEATQALRHVLNRALVWGLIEYNPAKRCSESAAPIEGEAALRVMGADRRDRRATPSEVRAVGRVRSCDRASSLRAVRARATRHRPSRGRLRAAGVRERPAQAHQDTAKHTRGSPAGDRD
jgi:hypothetical protein